jgi:beta-galactosidase/beta-glucuronidase
MQRQEWLNLNGTWRFKADPERKGLKERWYLGGDFNDTITVPFPIESEASGIHNLSPEKTYWYATEFNLPVSWQNEVLLHIGASDYRTRVFINGTQVCDHAGGYTPITANITHALEATNNLVVILVEDDIGWTQPRGKQAGTTKWPIDYDTVTGIWQTVWLEPIGKTHITALHNAFDIAKSELTLTIESNLQSACSVEVYLSLNQVNATSKADMNQRAEARCTFSIENPELWRPERPNLYDLKIKLIDETGNVLDEISSYVGLREVGHKDGYVTLNGEKLYLRGVLDQGYFPTGWYTPIDDDAIKKDVELTLAMGFNITRKHQKIEDPRFLYWADKLGLLVWEEMPSGRVFSNELTRALTNEWLEVLKRDRQHPCIIAWVPFNESWGVWHQSSRPEQRSLVDSLVSLTKACDQSRLVIGNDGWEFSSGDLWTLHLYDGEEQSLAERLGQLVKDPHTYIVGEGSDGRIGALPGATVEGLPVILTECGGIGYMSSERRDDAFSYGDIPTSEQELLTKFEQVARTVNETKQLKGFVWTQLTDVQQEVNGVLYFDRSPKLPIEKILEVMLGIGE